MRVRCPACGAPYVVPQVLPPDQPRCPNCDAPTPSESDAPRYRRTAPVADAGRSRAVTVVALAHLFVAAGGLCTSVGMAAVAGERGPGRGSLAAMVFAGCVAFTWAVVGVGLLVRWVGAWYVSLVLVGVTLLFAAVNLLFNPCGAIYFGVLSCAILPVLIARREEFR